MAPVTGLYPYADPSPVIGRPEMETWHVYQLRSDAELLYVGYTRRLRSRIGDHRRQKPWWPEVAEVWSEEFATEDDARQREKELWVAERPKYNKRNPFRTPEEMLENRQTYYRTPEYRQHHRERHRVLYRQIPEFRERVKERARKSRRLRKGLPQTGPGLFLSEGSGYHRRTLLSADPRHAVQPRAPVDAGRVAERGRRQFRGGHVLLEGHRQQRGGRDDRQQRGYGRGRAERDGVADTGGAPRRDHGREGVPRHGDEHGERAGRDPFLGCGFRQHRDRRGGRRAADGEHGGGGVDPDDGGRAAGFRPPGRRGGPGAVLGDGAGDGPGSREPRAGAVSHRSRGRTGILGARTSPTHAGRRSQATCPPPRSPASPAAARLSAVPRSGARTPRPSPALPACCVGRCAVP